MVVSLGWEEGSLHAPIFAKSGQIQRGSFLRAGSISMEEQKTPTKPWSEGKWLIKNNAFFDTTWVVFLLWTPGYRVADLVHNAAIPLRGSGLCNACQTAPGASSESASKWGESHCPRDAFTLQNHVHCKIMDLGQFLSQRENFWGPEMKSTLWEPSFLAGDLPEPQASPECRALLFFHVGLDYQEILWVSHFWGVGWIRLVGWLDQ